MDFLGGLISGAANLIGGLFGQHNADRTAQHNAQMQSDFAQWGATWRARDVTRAENETGINRLALLGVPTNSFSNVVGSNELGDSIGRAGQDIGRAVAAGTAKPSRADQLNEELLEAKIANVKADTVRMAATASAIATKLGQPGTGPGVPLPSEDPRGPVIQLYQRARDYRTGEIIDIPSEKAASPLQTIAASPVNAAMAARTVGDAVSPPYWWSGAFGPAARATQDYNWTYGVP